ncbi:LysR family transcriptional regulator [Trinickia caryophylli]|uniref:Transcriptional regulator, LysR family n=1 Tax=Trinickia caryophylli TaxID=28094 RepID=A0A1X7DIN6_TRICW|nr:LysR family transcriptional regulator [Trinickia caryophylli]PMS12274.1 LysR family transcriptional regulator [Trinickia caryophylli]TRX17056.1 LysR family transcriptional regulator [Trinickia caryophylli]WQE12210.1 LysR family transcriptional regulator [Trinickia caryophylli]SMF16319.1 transcriptional regulator, LysR family [Trinickia caryophylli]GLU31655.1 LysR family transcriptional regulator [Trinickia caryophylli]
MARLKQIETFVAVAAKGSLSAAAAAEGVAPAVIGRRLDALEERLGVKLFVRTTRKLTLTFEGSAFLEDCQRIVHELNHAEASVSAGGVKASGHLRVSAPAGFGRKHVAPLVPAFAAAHPDVSITLDLSDRLVDLVNEGFDCAVRLGELPDSSLVSLKLGENRRVCVGAPAYLEHRGTPQTLADLARHNCLALAANANQQRAWSFQEDGKAVSIKVSGTMECTDGAVLREWCVLGYGLAWRSWWEVGADIAAGRLVTVLDGFAAPPIGIHAVFAQRRHLPLRVRLFLDYLKHTYERADYWR